MTKRQRRKSMLMFLGGLSVGLSVGVGMLIGALASRDRDDSSQLETPIFGLAAHGGDSFAIATGPIDDEVEGIFALDFLTGELQCWVINSRTGQFNAVYKYNVLLDLEVGASEKKPSFAITTGIVDFPRGGGINRPAKSVVYVADCNTGNIAAYTLGWNRNLAAAARPQQGVMALLGKFKGRSSALRE